MIKKKETLQTLSDTPLITISEKLLDEMVKLVKSKQTLSKQEMGLLKLRLGHLNAHIKAFQQRSGHFKNISLVQKLKVLKAYHEKRLKVLSKGKKLK